MPVQNAHLLNRQPIRRLQPMSLDLQINQNWWPIVWLNRCHSMHLPCNKWVLFHYRFDFHIAMRPMDIIHTLMPDIRCRCSNSRRNRFRVWLWCRLEKHDKKDDVIFGWNSNRSCSILTVDYWQEISQIKCVSLTFVEATWTPHWCRLIANLSNDENSNQRFDCSIGDKEKKCTYWTCDWDFMAKQLVCRATKFIRIVNNCWQHICFNRK